MDSEARICCGEWCIGGREGASPVPPCLPINNSRFHSADVSVFFLFL
jgi:hypothetical protein